MKYLLIGLLKTWRLLVSPWYGNVCRYYPSCSAYALRAVQYHGALQGSYLAIRRLLSCHPWSAGGYDPVRGTPEFDEEMRAQHQQTTTMERETGSASAADQHETMSQGQYPHQDQGEVVTLALGHDVVTSGGGKK